MLTSLLEHNDTISNMGNLEFTNSLMGVRNREEISQTLSLNVSNHERKRKIMDLIEQTKSKNTKEEKVTSTNEPGDKTKALKDDVGLTLDMQYNYPLCKPIVFSNPYQDDFVHGGVWRIKS